MGSDDNNNFEKIIGKAAEVTDRPFDKEEFEEGLSHEQKKLDIEQQKAELKKKKLDLDHMEAELRKEKQNIEMRKAYSQRVYNYLCMYSAFCAVIIALQGFCPEKFFHISDTPLSVLMGSTAVGAIGLVLAVIKGLFK